MCSFKLQVFIAEHALRALWVEHNPDVNFKLGFLRIPILPKRMNSDISIAAARQPRQRMRQHIMRVRLAQVRGRKPVVRHPAILRMHV